jgi:hypothetical protein
VAGGAPGDRDDDLWRKGATDHPVWTRRAT